MVAKGIIPLGLKIVRPLNFNWRLVAPKVVGLESTKEFRLIPFLPLRGGLTILFKVLNWLVGLGINGLDLGLHFNFPGLPVGFGTWAVWKNFLEN